MKINWSKLSPRERDAVIAVKIFGLATRKKHNAVIKYTLYEMADPRISTFKKYKPLFLASFNQRAWNDAEIRQRWNEEKWVNLPQYTTLIGPAWEVLQTLSSQGIYMRISNVSGAGRFRVSTEDRITDFYTSAPEAICFAALKAKGIEIE